MENKKLIKILLKDMTELEELISEVKDRGKFESLEIEFIHTRAKGILQLLNILDNKESSGASQVPTAIENDIYQTDIKLTEKEEAPMHDGAGLKEEQVPGNEIPDEKDKIQNDSISQLTEKKVKPPVMNGKMIDEEEMLEESVEIISTKSRLGESFLKGKSINDMITEQNKLEFKLSNRPVSSIRAAIGINDRFQYIRELFDNDAKKFSESIAILDSMKNENEAAEYLLNNFKWKKNETSLKFINLVKRRFHHE